jgi:1-acyl-sn-glycerol-3-phosphate acyltransferase
MSGRSGRGGHTPFGRCLYSFLWIFCRTIGVSVFGFRVRFTEPLPATGGLLVLSSHQSHLDPLIIGLATDRRMSSLARSSLYTFKPFGAVITALDAVPIDRNASMVTAMKQVIARLQQGAAVVMFPEGTRTADGRLGEIRPGFALIAKRAAVPIVPVAIVGAYECWPRWRLLPRPGRIRVEFGRVMPVDEAARMSDRDLTAEVVRQLAELDARGRAARAGEPAPRGSGSITAGSTNPGAA